MGQGVLFCFCMVLALTFVSQRVTTSLVVLAVNNLAFVATPPLFMGGTAADATPPGRAASAAAAVVVLARGAAAGGAGVPARRRTDLVHVPAVSGLRDATVRDKLNAPQIQSGRASR